MSFSNWADTPAYGLHRTYIFAKFFTALEIGCEMRSNLLDPISVLSTFLNKTVVATLIALFCAFAFKANAVVIVNDAAIIPHPFNPPDQLLTLTQSIPAGQGMFAIDIASLGSDQFRFSYAGIAEEYGLFAVSLGTALDPAFALSHTPLVTNDVAGPGNSVLVFAPNQNIYFGYWDDRNFNGVADGNDNFGWVRIARGLAGLEASSSATAIGGGIIVGSTTQIPEPASVLLIPCAVALLVCFRRRNEPWNND
jgi:hypothetical protein